MSNQKISLSKFFETGLTKTEMTTAELKSVLLKLDFDLLEHDIKNTLIFTEFSEDTVLFNLICFFGVTFFEQMKDFSLGVVDCEDFIINVYSGQAETNRLRLMSSSSRYDFSLYDSIANKDGNIISNNDKDVCISIRMPFNEDDNEGIDNMLLISSSEYGMIGDTEMIEVSIQPTGSYAS